MKLAIIVFSAFCFFFQDEEHSDVDKVIVIIDQVPWSRPLANTIKTFWLDKEHFDTIQITGKTLLSDINKTLDNMTVTQKYSDISYESCIIRFSKGNAIDTFYSWGAFDYFKKGSIMYFDSTKRIQELFMKSHHTFQTR